MGNARYVTLQIQLALNVSIFQVGDATNPIGNWNQYYLPFSFSRDTQKKAAAAAAHVGIDATPFLWAADASCPPPSQTLPPSPASYTVSKRLSQQRTRAGFCYPKGYFETKIILFLTSYVATYVYFFSLRVLLIMHKELGIPLSRLILLHMPGRRLIRSGRCHAGNLVLSLLYNLL